MRDTVETFDGIEKLKLATVAAALLIPPIFMMVVVPQQRTTSVEATAVSITTPIKSDGPAATTVPVRAQFKTLPSSYSKPEVAVNPQTLGVVTVR